METTSDDASWLDRNIKWQDINTNNVVRSGLLGINQHEKKWCRAAETSDEVYRCKIHSELDNTSPHFSRYGKRPSIHEIRTFGCDIYPITLLSKNLDGRTQEGSFMVYNASRAKMKFWDTNTYKIKYIFHLPNLMNITINLEKYGQPVIN